MNDDVAYYEVKWKGYNETTLELREVLLKDVPKMVKQFEKKRNDYILSKHKQNNWGKNSAVSHVKIVFFMFKI